MESQTGGYQLLMMKPREGNSFFLLEVPNQEKIYRIWLKRLKFYPKKDSSSTFVSLVRMGGKIITSFGIAQKAVFTVKFTFLVIAMTKN